MQPTIDEIISAVLEAQNNSVAPGMWSRYAEAKNISTPLVDITIAQAREFYEDLFSVTNVRKLPILLHFPVFDWYSNSGFRAVEALQRLLNEKRGDQDIEIDVDGRIGAKTIALSVRLCNTKFVDLYSLERIKFYSRIVERNPSYAKTLLRWLDRTEKFFSFTQESVV